MQLHGDEKLLYFVKTYGLEYRYYHDETLNGWVYEFRKGNNRLTHTISDHQMLTVVDGWDTLVEYLIQHVKREFNLD